MELIETIAWIAFALIVAQWAAELWLSHLNRRHVIAHAGRIPDAFKGIMDEETYAKSVRYTLARNRFGRFRDIYGTLILIVVLFSGVLPWVYSFVLQHWGSSAWVMALFLLVLGLALSLPNLPLDWIDQFRLEQRFGFNTTTQKTWWLDRIKGVLIMLVLGGPLLLLVLKCIEWSGALWWLYAWTLFMGFQLLMMILAPVLILPLFNKLTPLPDGSLKDRLNALAHKTRFVARSIQVMDGSRRSRHSNAFFTGLGRLRKIVLFDTLIEQLDEVELEAVLAHEIGHYKRKHIPKMLIGSALGTLIGFYCVAWLAREPAFIKAFGFAVSPDSSATALDQTVPALLLFALLAGTVTFWLSPVLHWISRRYEYEADAFARTVMNDAQPLVTALRKMNEKNLSNLTPHPVFSGFYYSHPTMLEREKALIKPA